jgi:hypothetical protein
MSLDSSDWSEPTFALPEGDVRIVLEAVLEESVDKILKTLYHLRRNEEQEFSDSIKEFMTLRSNATRWIEEVA